MRIHRVAFNRENHTIERTFLKITVSRQIMNREGNEHNGLFDYNWPMVPRSSTKRNHANVVYEPQNDPTISFEYWSVEKIQNIFSHTDLSRAMKNAVVEAYVATPGELLQTDSNSFATTVNVAKPGDWKITTKLGSQYFLPSKLFEQLYTPQRYGKFASLPIPVTYYTLTKHIQIVAPWGRVQYLRPGDYLVKRTEQDIYGVLQSDFEHAYDKRD